MFQHAFEDDDPGTNTDSSGTDIGALSSGDYDVIYDEANDTHFVAIDGAALESGLSLED